MKNIISLPKFGGFYEEYFTDDYLECEVDYSATYERVAELCVTCPFDGYAIRLTEEFPNIVTSVTFHELDSPRYFNFRTEEILAVIDYDYIFLQHLVFVEQREAFAAWLKENYSSRDGFISFITTDVQEFIAGLKEEQPTDTDASPGYSKCLTVVFQYLCRDWDYIHPENMDGVGECIVTK